MSEMQKGFLYNHIRYKAFTSSLMMFAIGSLGAVFAAAGVSVGLEEGEGWCCIGPVILVAGGFAAMMWFAGAAYFMEYLDPARSDAFEGLQRHGDPKDVVVEIEMELVGDDKEVFGPAKFLTTWIVATGEHDVHLVKYNELVSIAHRTSARRVKGIKVGENHHLDFVTAHEEFTMNVKAEHVENVLLCVRQRTESGSVEFL